MTTETDAEDGGVLPPDEAFAVLGNETRIQILQSLGQSEAPLVFSELRDRVGMSDTGQFNYHLNKLVGHFVRKTDAGYKLRQPGHRVIQAILSGSVTGAPELDATDVDAPCIYCGSATEVSFRQERLLWRCTECAGTFADREATSEAFGTLPKGTIDLAYLPAAAVEGRTAREMLEASDVWSASEDVALYNGVCSRCAGNIERSVSVCQDHDDGGEVCEECHTRLGITVSSNCTNCSHETQGTLLVHLMADPAFRSVFDSRGIDVIATPLELMGAFEVVDHEVLDTDPLRVRITHAVAGDRVSLIVGDDLSVSEVIEEAPGTPG